MRIAVDQIEAIRYKLRMFGIPLDGVANVFCDNQSVVINATIPVSTLKKKHNAIAYHRVREAIASRIIRVAKVRSEENLADMLTKPLVAVKLKYLIQRILWYHSSEARRMQSSLTFVLRGLKKVRRVYVKGTQHE
jgi:hypothetical protein